MLVVRYNTNVMPPTWLILMTAITCGSISSTPHADYRNTGHAILLLVSVDVKVCSHCLGSVMPSHHTLPNLTPPTWLILMTAIICGSISSTP